MHIFPLGSSPGWGSSGQAWAGKPFGFPRASLEPPPPPHTPRHSAPRFFGRFPHKQLNRAPTSHLQKCAFSLEIQMHNLTPPSLGTPKSRAFPGGTSTHTGAQLRISPKETKESEAVLPRPSLLPPPEPGPAPPPGFRARVGGAPARGGRRARSASALPTALAPRTPGAPAPARSPSRLRATGRSPGSCPGLRPRPPRGAQRASLGATRPARRTPSGKSPSAQHPTLAPQNPLGSRSKPRG